eukprot:EST46125.1 Hypothetical protein SS50377_14120 [Spironucleus salmonicida]
MQQTPQDLLREIDSVLNKSMTKDEIKDKLVKSRSNSGRNSRSNSVSGRTVSQMSSIYGNEIQPQSVQNQTMPQYSNQTYQQQMANQSYQPSYRNDQSIITPQNQPLTNSVVHNKYDTPQSLNLASPSIMNNQHQISQLQDEISRLTNQSNQSLRSHTPNRVTPQQITPQSLQNITPIIQENQPNVDLKSQQNSLMAQNHSQMSQKSNAFAIQQPNTSDTFMDPNTTFTSEYVDELQKENLRLKKNYIDKELKRMINLLETPMLEKEELDYIIESSFKEYIKI